MIVLLFCAPTRRIDSAQRARIPRTTHRKRESKTYRLGYFVQGCQIAGDQSEIAAFFGQSDGGCAANSFGSAGDQRELA